MIIDIEESGLRLKVTDMSPEAQFCTPDKTWNKAQGCFFIPANLRTARRLEPFFQDFTRDAKDWLETLMALDELRERNALLRRNRDQIDTSGVMSRRFGKSKPMLHQAQAMELSIRLPGYAYLMQQGTGKTFCAINDAAELYRRGEIDVAVVLAPNSVKTNWMRVGGGQCELRDHMPDDVPWSGAVHVSPATRQSSLQWAEVVTHIRQKRVGLKWLVLNYEALTNGKIQVLLRDICQENNVLLIADESTRIKNFSASRTKAALALSRLCSHRRIMTGTMIIKSPENAWAQLRFLGAEEMPYDNFTSFKKRFVKSVWGGKFDKVVGYSNQEELGQLIDRVSFSVLKRDCLDLPEKVYQKVYVPMDKAQSEAYEDMRKKAIVMLQDKGVEVVATIVLTQVLRLQQIACGYLPNTDGGVADLGFAGKIDAALEIIEDAEAKCIVWATFSAQIDAMTAALTKAGIGWRRIDGRDSDAERVLSRDLFQDPKSDVTVLVCNQAAVSMGVTLTAADTAIYMSNNFSTESRVQSEDRCHRRGSEIHSSVNYYDVLTENTVEDKVLDVLRANRALSDEIMREGWERWF